MSVNEMVELLRRWGLAPPYVDSFVAEEYTIDSLKLLTAETILKHIPKEGPRSTFENNLKLLRESGDTLEGGEGEDEDDEDNTPLSSRRAKKRKLDNTQLQLILSLPDKNSLHKALKKSMPGIIVLGFYAANSFLDEYTRNLLCTQVIYKGLENDFNRLLTRDDYSSIADDIVVLFPTEDKETWYSVVQKGKATTIQGRLRFKYYSLRRGLISSQLIKPTPVQTEINVDSSISELGDDLEDASFQWLCSNTAPWSEVLSKWGETR
ncbi:Inner kinetochore subunit NKP2 [Frankliniella fusca]|uniref:Inner kinetochore subunit NKP2 n=1 Tax=Frankliniella fusca TaxID=407009 RepID=A0AAE1L6K9_9NEOP|nr:Inner kinetochore subunit NKP2 [Frankliniella fusca]